MQVDEMEINLYQMKINWIDVCILNGEVCYQ